MSASLFSNLTKGALQALPAITGFVNQGGMSNSAILSAVRAAGFGIRTQVGLDIINALQGNMTAARSIRLTNSSTPLNPANYGTAIGNLLRNFSYAVKITGETGNRFVTVSSNVALSQDQILATAETYGSKYGDSSIGATVDMTVTDSLKSADYAL
jgi:hypothetical protein